MKIQLLLIPFLMLTALSCGTDSTKSKPEAIGAAGSVSLMTLNPGHFHAGLVQKVEYELVDPVVHIYAPAGKELEAYLALIERFNTRDDDPTYWTSEIYRGADFLERMLSEKPGNVMVVAGDNGQKIVYIRRAVEEGINVLADKPMIIHPDSFEVLKKTLELADEKGLLVSDIMTERHEITSILQGELSRNRDLFGELLAGSIDEPSISKESVHHFSKIVAGALLVRPAWFFDVNQQGEAIVDVATHLVDLILWQIFPGEGIDYESHTDDVQVLTARSWTTRLTPSQFRHVTEESYPDYLLPYVENDSMLTVASNGEFVFSVRGIHGKVSVRWEYENPGGGDTHYSIMRGSRASLVVRQNQEQNYRATLYVESAGNSSMEEVKTRLEAALTPFGEKYPGLSIAASPYGWEIQVPDGFREGHEEHFARVTERYLEDLVAGKLPEWERKNLLTKYFITTQAYRLSR